MSAQNNLALRAVNGLVYPSLVPGWRTQDFTPSTTGRTSVQVLTDGPGCSRQHLYPCHCDKHDWDSEV